LVALTTVKTSSVGTLKAAIPKKGVARLVQAHPEFFDGIAFDFAEADGPGADVMPRMVNELAYDVCDMSPSSFLIALERGVPITALPIMTYCGFPFDQIDVRVAAGIDTPRDLAGKTIGVRTWTNPMKPWLFAILRREYGIDAHGCSWVATINDPLAGVAMPSNARRSDGRSLAALMAAGEIDAAVMLGKTDARDIIPLFTDPLTTAADWYKRTGILPIFHLLAVKTATIERYPGLANALVDGFTRAKELYIEQLHSVEPDVDELVANDRRIMQRLGIDPVPYGIERNRASLEMFIEAMVDHGYLKTPPTVESLFARVRELT
jgi:4,5-dihydroxyphthalate decarboxylase